VNVHRREVYGLMPGFEALDVQDVVDEVGQPAAFSEHNLCSADLNLVPVRIDTWGGCAFINFDDEAPGLRDAA